MSDTSSVRSSVRSSVFLSRPQLVPTGPRTRQSTLRLSTVNNYYAGPSSTPTVAEPARPDSPANIPLPLSRSNSMSPKPLPQAPSPAKLLPSPVSNSSPLPVVQESLLPSIASVAAPPLDSQEFDFRRSSQSSAGTSTSGAGNQTTLPTLTEEEAKMSLQEEEEEDMVPAYSHLQGRDSTSQIPPLAAELLEPPVKVSPIYSAHPKLVPPPPIKFETTPVVWKGLSLEASLWTFNSKELQDIVSRAIRASSKESFIRLLTIDNLDTVLPAELERLESEKATTQARYRFLVHRRTMLFQALNSSSSGPPKGDDPAVPLVSKLAAQLAETITDCDQRLEEIININDQICQVNRLIDVHSTSALAIALRKLNGSYARRTKDLNTARDRIFQLEAELNDAWREAEKVAQELDDYEAAISTEDTEVIIKTAEVVAVPTSPSDSYSRTASPQLLNKKRSIPLSMSTATLLEVRSISSPSPTAQTILLPVSNPTSPTTTSHFAFPPVTSTEEVEKDDSDAVSVKSTKSNKSSKSVKVLRASSIQAAKKRSSRASQSSLRFINTHSRSGSGARTPLTDNNAPPLPDMPLHFVLKDAGVQSLKGGMSQEFGYNGPASAAASSTLLHSTVLGHGRQISSSTAESSSMSQEVTMPPPTPSLPQPLASPVPTLKRQASLDTVCTVGKTSPAAVDAYRGKPLDDIYLRMGSQSRQARSPIAFSPIGPYSTLNIPIDIPWDDEDIQVVPRTPPYRIPTFERQRTLSDHALLPPRPPPKDSDKKGEIPSMWMNADAVKALHAGRSTSTPLMKIQTISLSPTSSPNSASISVAASLPLSNGSGDSATVSDTLSLPAHSTLRPRLRPTYDKLKGLTKRYSTAIPLFSGKNQKAGTSRGG